MAGEDVKENKEQSPAKDERDSDVLTQGDFEKLEKEFGKKQGIIDKVLGRGKKKKSEDSEEKGAGETLKSDEIPAKIQKLSSSIDDLTLKHEKLEGKFEAEKGSREALNERISMLTEEIGELRSMILDREKTFNDIQMGFEKISDMARDFDPKRITGEFDKKEKMIVDNTIKIDKIGTLVDTLRSDLKAYKDQMSKIKSFENLVDVYTKIKEQVDQIEKDKEYTSRIAAKVENLYSDLSERLGKLITYQEKIETASDMIKELTVTVDQFDAKTKNKVNTDEFKKAVATMQASVDNVTMKLSEITQNLIAIEKRLMSSTEVTSQFDEVHKAIDDMGKAILEVEKKHAVHVEGESVSQREGQASSEPRNVIRSSPDAIESDIYKIITQANYALSKDNTILAKTLYLQAIDRYKELQNYKTPRMSAIYLNIKTLYDNINMAMQAKVQAQKEGAPPQQYNPLIQNLKSAVEAGAQASSEAEKKAESANQDQANPLKSKIDSLIADFEKAIENKELDKATALYSEILETYEKLKNSSYPEIGKVYESVRDIYHKLKEAHGKI